jgi:hypothetical protein
MFTKLRTNCLRECLNLQLKALKRGTLFNQGLLVKERAKQSHLPRREFNSKKLNQLQLQRQSRQQVILAMRQQQYQIQVNKLTQLKLYSPKSRFQK